MEFNYPAKTAVKPRCFEVYRGVSFGDSGVQLLSAWSEFSIDTAFVAVREGIRCA
jgi:hypothetical protein